ncbi:LysR family transcriptional regulator [Marinobacterium aestuariivivens]|uniref:LysR family transcriptional regulator n=1 Tax=Marinobacterium aestuariivivens TaxID=1698799 RepID=A0ABW1ZZD6_9GAMM
MDFQNLYLFVRVVERGSYIAAATELQIPTSTLSRRIQQLEEDLGYKLLYRSARKLSLTEAGRLFYNRCHSLYADLVDATSGIDSELTSPSGKLKITAPVSLANELLNPWFFEFMTEHPGIELDLMLLNRNIDLKDEGVDIAFRIGEIGIPDWISRPLFSSRFCLCASPDLVERLGMPASLEDLARYPIIASRRSPSWIFTDREGTSHELQIRPRLIFDELRTAADAVAAGIGIANLPHYVVDDALEKQRLVSLLPDYRPQSREVQMLYPHRKYLPAKVRLFIDFIMERIEGYRGDEASG